VGDTSLCFIELRLLVIARLFDCRIWLRCAGRSEGLDGNGMERGRNREKDAQK
jgi:hypothetical protein